MAISMFRVQSVFSHLHSKTNRYPIKDMNKLKIPWVGYILLGSALFSIGAVWNKAPILFYDSINYITDGLNGRYVSIRMVTYPLFVKITSFSGLSLWGTLLAQNLMLSFLLWRMQIDLTKKVTVAGFMLICALSALVFGGTWIQSQIMADAMTPVCVLSFILILLPSTRTLSYELMIWATFAISALSHASHLIILSLAFITITAMSRFVRTPQFAFQIKKTGGILVAIFLLSPLINKAATGDFIPVQSSQPHLLARLIETGIIDRLLSEKCGEKKYIFCANKPIPETEANDFLWGNHGMMRGNTYRNVDNPEYAIVIRDSFRYYPMAIFLADLRSFFSQLVHYKLGDRLNTIEMREQILFIIMYDPLGFAAFSKAKQIEGKLHFTWPNRLLITSFVLMFLILLSRRFRETLLKDKRKYWAFMILVVYVISNAAVCASLSNVRDRYQARVVWLLPTLLFLLSFEVMSEIQIRALTKRSGV